MADDLQERYFPTTRPPSDGLQERYFPVAPVPTAHPVTRYAGAPDEPLEPAMGPFDLGLSLYSGGLSGKIGASVAAKAGPFLRSITTGLGLEAGYKAQQATGMTTGRPVTEWPQNAQAASEVGWPDALNVGLPVLSGTLASLKRGVFGWTRAGKALAAADDLNTAQDLAHAQAVQEAQAVRDAAHDAAVQTARDRLNRGGSYAEYIRLRDTPAPEVTAAEVPRLPRAEPVVAPAGHSGTRRLGEIATGVLAGTLSGQGLKGVLQGAVTGGTLAAADWSATKIAQVLTKPAWRDWLRGQMTSEGLSPYALGILATVGRGAVPGEPPTTR